ncbi:MAG TPA: carboxylating nicotinate-nucleotide diphosphorylase [Verrucomicrobiae bacterium]|nr:carboxylating nicotinate-nucleotide diphosphorylase [Verrucomicrobiae bacterium]
MAGPLEEFRETVRSALKEDLGAGDATTDSTIPADAQAIANMVAREPLVVAGLNLARMAFEERGPTLKFESAVEDGAKLKKGAVLLSIRGNARGILEAERVALNFVQRLSGIATLTNKYVEAVKGTNAKILDTRKTLPGWRKLEKYAVKCGGGQNHRFGLDDMILIKDNHLAVLRKTTENPVQVAVLAARAKYPKLKIEVEADTIDQAVNAAHAGADIVLLDNMNLETLAAAVGLVRQLGKPQTEASGGVTLETVTSIAGSGVDFISVGAITHSARAVDIALDFELQ